MKCFNCGTEYDANVYMNCPSCNAPHQPVQQYQPAQYQPIQQEPQKKKKKKGCLTAIIIFVVVVVIAGVLFSGGDDTSSTNSTDGNSTTVSTTEETTLSENDYKAQCTNIKYNDLARNPDNYIGTYCKFTGEVQQVVEDGTYLISVTKDEYGFYDDNVYAIYDFPEGSSRILEDDIVTLYGQADGLYTYTSVLGESISIPQVNVEYIDIQ